MALTTPTTVTWSLTKRFTDGPLEGIVVTDTMTLPESSGAPFRSGDVVTYSAWSGSGYVVLACDRVVAEPTCPECGDVAEYCSKFAATLR